jgi:hypothetical protein
VADAFGAQTVGTGRWLVLHTAYESRQR